MAFQLQVEEERVQVERVSPRFKQRPRACLTPLYQGIYKGREEQFAYADTRIVQCFEAYGQMREEAGQALLHRKERDHRMMVVRYEMACFALYLQDNGLLAAGCPTASRFLASRLPGKQARRGA